MRSIPTGSRPLGPDIDAFEREMAERIGVGTCRGTLERNGSSAPGSAVGRRRTGDEVLVPSFTFIATAAAVTYLGARPGLRRLLGRQLEPGPRSRRGGSDRAGQLGPAPVRRDHRRPLRGDRRLPALGVAVRRFEVPLIEDSAEALGATYRGRAAGSFGVAGIFSFNGNKIITTSGGGMLVTQSAAARRRGPAIWPLRPESRSPTTSTPRVGYNYRLSNLLAALGRAQLRGLDNRIERRQQIDAAYVAGLVRPARDLSDATHRQWHLELLAHLHPDRSRGLRSGPRRRAVGPRSHDIESRPTWKPLHLQPAFTGSVSWAPGTAPASSTGACACPPGRRSHRPTRHESLRSSPLRVNAEQRKSGPNEDPHRRLRFPVAADSKAATSVLRLPSRHSPPWERQISFPSATIAGRHPPCPRQCRSNGSRRSFVTESPHQLRWRTAWLTRRGIPLEVEMQRTDRASPSEFRVVGGAPVRPRLVRQGCNVRGDAPPASRSNHHRPCMTSKT